MTRAASARQGGDARAEILAAAEALILEDGYERASIRRLCDRCGYSAPTVYHHFGDKRGLMDEVVEAAFRRLLARLRRVKSSDDPLRTARAQLLAFIRFGTRNPDHYRLLLSPRTSSEDLPLAGRECRALLEAPMNELHEQGRLRAPDLESAFQAFWAIGHGVITLRVTQPNYEWSPQLAEVAVDSLLHGVLRADPQSEEDEG
jgi:AcrR family transcriptional regulator